MLGGVIMFCNCTSLEECEKILMSKLDGIDFIGQVQLFDEDFKTLVKLIKDYIYEDNSWGIRYLMKNAPACLAFLLVNCGIYGYKEGNYWACVSEVLGNLDTATQTRLGKFFLEFVNRHNLANIDTESTYKYVAPILIHGGIPQSCLDEYLNKIVMHFYDNQLRHSKQILDYLYEIREKYQKKNKLEKELEYLKDQYQTALTEQATLRSMIKECSQLKSTLNLHFFNLFKQDFNEQFEEAIEQIELDAIKSKFDEYNTHCTIAKNLENKLAQFKVEEIKIKPHLWIGFVLTLIGLVLFSTLELIIPLAISVIGIIPLFYGVGVLLKDRKRFILEKARYQELNKEIEQEKIHIHKLKEDLKQLFGNLPYNHGFLVMASEEFTAKLAPIKESFHEYMRSKVLLDQHVTNVVAWKRIEGHDIIESSVDSLNKYYIDKINNLMNEIGEKENKLESISLPTFYTEETVLRFLLYGGEWSDTWLIEILKMIDDLEKYGSPVDPNKYNLPKRVIDAFNKWRANMQHASLENKRNYTEPLERFSAPELMLDPVLGELKISMGNHRLKYRDGQFDNPIYIKVKTQSQEQLAYSQLKAYIYNNDAVETTKIDIPIYTLSSTYTIILESGGRILKEWEVEGIKEDLPYLIFRENGAKVQGAELPQQRLWLLCPDNWTPYPEVHILEESTLVQFKEDFKLILIDLSNTAQLSIVDSNTGDKVLSLKTVRVNEPFLLGAEPLLGVTSNGLPIYSHDIPSLMIPFDSTENIDDWTLVISRGTRLWDERKFYRLKELSDITVSENNTAVQIPLHTPQLLGNNPLGWYGIYLTNSKGKEHRFYMVFIPDLMVIFDPHLYIPSQGKNVDIMTTLILPENSKFEIRSEGTIISVVDEAYDIMVPDSEDILLGNIIFSIRDDEQDILPIEVEMPKVKWNLYGLKDIHNSQGVCDIDEIWLDDWLESENLTLEVELPEDKGDYIIISADGLDQYVDTMLKSGRARVSLMAFTDTIKASPGVYNFTIEIYDRRHRKLFKGMLFALRTVWEIEDFSYAIYNTVDSNKLISLKWKDKGNPNNRIIRFWRTDNPWKMPITIPIQDGENSLVLDMGLHDLATGRYLVQFDIEDPWMGSTMGLEFPVQADKVYDIFIENNDKHIRILDFLWLSNNSIKVIGKTSSSYKGSMIEIALVGHIKDKTRIAKVSTQIDHKGNFSALITNNGVNLKELSRWIFVKVDAEMPVYQISLLPTASAIQTKLSNYICDYLYDSLFDVSMDFYTGEKVLANSTLYNRNARKLMQAWRAGNGSIELGWGKGGDQHNLKLTWDKEKDIAFIEIQEGVKCTSCGEIVKNQQVWDAEHYPKCKSLVPNYKEKIEVLMLVRWEYEEVIRTVTNTYPLAGNDPFVLFNSWHRPLPEGVDIRNIFDGNSRDFIRLLIEKEKELAIMVWEGNYKDEY